MLSIINLNLIKHLKVTLINGITCKVKFQLNYKIHIDLIYDVGR